ncbi:hypothetical protein CAEBREN_20660 [Caenorhabditis brenneri]|uniref:SKP1 component POZ domain-containing protein n=1 Tax=Caenorhabditis brenneri TaxID=135651 RepID=G0NLZ2_CAEBE|nr:hypothetical protein CAEBREN_20660 [Caenorhabditis brenneri]
MSFYIISSNDGRKFRVPANAAKHSETVMECISENNIAPNSPIAMQQPVSGMMLDRIISWCEHHKYGSVPSEITEWDRNLLTTENRIERMNLISAAGLMRIKELKRMSIALFCERETTQDTGFIQLQSKDTHVFQMTLGAAKQSLLLAQILEKLSGKAPVLPIPIDFTSAQLDVVVKWCEHHRGEPISVLDDDGYPFNVLVPEFDKNLLKIGNADLVKVMNAATALEINALIRSATKTWFDRQRSMTQEELSALF